MKRRKNPIYTGQSKRASTGQGNRAFVDAFYKNLNERLRPEDEIEIISPEQVNPTYALPKQLFIVADYCVRKILPEVTGLYHWADEITPRLRAVVPIVDPDTAYAATDAAYHADLHATTFVAYDAANYDVAFAAGGAGRVATAAGGGNARGYSERATAHVTYAAENAAYAAENAARCVYHALVVCIAADHEAAYNRIIELTNEMLESL